MSTTTAEMEAVETEGGPEEQGAVAAGHTGIPVKPVWASLEEAVQIKTEGNAFYRERNIRSAIGRYHRALLVLRGLDADLMAPVKGFAPQTPPLTPEQDSLLRKTQVDCYNNLAACLLQKQKVDYARVLEYSLRVLRWQPGNVKALYRAGVATLEIGDAESAKQYLTQACRAQPNDTSVKRHLQRAEEKLNQELQKEKAMYRGMFSSGPQDGSGEEVSRPNGAGDRV
ncbi:tetratricopeptide repeat protein 9C [Austrofundulus limnaeus]|uniref:Tetratricopeptide repeat protein 9C n=1 Tax=Austrofundulus limnaeus TaxID=52670 RepID=A0A2I4B1V6_AUSLI|nr:PREDICTED: tetratricopeptide repeat protein 9C-like [Austrofundulus limnaeus]